MRKDLLRLNELKCAIIECAMRFELAKKELDFVIQDQHIFKHLEEELIYNVNFLKRKKVTVVATEYKKSIYELKYVSNKLRDLRNRYDAISLRMQQLEDMHLELTAEYEVQVELCKNYRVVVPFDRFRKRNEK